MTRTFTAPFVVGVDADCKRRSGVCPHRLYYDLVQVVDKGADDIEKQLIDRIISRVGHIPLLAASMRSLS
jgi:hypothetical protein